MARDLVGAVAQIGVGGNSDDDARPVLGRFMYLN
jgi:hypothetical protein